MVDPHYHIPAEPGLSHIIASSQATVCSDELIFSKIQRPPNGMNPGILILSQREHEDVIEQWTGQVAQHAPLGQILSAVPFATPRSQIVVIGCQPSEQLRAMLASKGYVATLHAPCLMHPHGGILFQSQIAIFDDMLTF